MASHSVLEQLLNDRVLVQIDGIRYKCGCGSIIRKSSIYGHIRSKFHIRWTKSVESVVEATCDICYDNRINFFTCPVCRNKHCTECHTRIDKCPYCRTVFENRVRGGDENDEDRDRIRIIGTGSRRVVMMTVFITLRR